jgi:predicted DNA-binding transcriptional regulator AlpA
MAEYSVMLEARRLHDARDDRRVSDDDLDTFADLLVKHHGVAGGRDRVWSAVVTIETSDEARALARGVHLIRQLAKKAGLPDWATSTAQVVTAGDLDREQMSSNRPELVSGPEAARMLGISRQRVHQLASENPEFPEPLYRLAVGSLWDRRAVVAFAQRWRGRAERTASEEDEASTS